MSRVAPVMKDEKFFDVQVQVYRVLCLSEVATLSIDIGWPVAQRVENPTPAMVNSFKKQAHKGFIALFPAGPICRPINVVRIIHELKREGGENA